MKRSDLDKPRTEPHVSEVQLGDAFGNDARLADKLQKIADIANSEASGSGGWKTVAFLKSLWEISFPVVARIAGAVKRGIAAFSDRETRTLLARHQVAKEKKLAAAEAERIRAEASLIDAKADRERAIAEEERARTQRKGDLLKFFLERGIDFSAEERDGLLRIAFIKSEHDGASGERSPS